MTMRQRKESFTILFYVGGNVMFCDNCGAKLPENAKFCTSCGTPITPIQPQDYQAQPQDYQAQPQDYQAQPQDYQPQQQYYQPEQALVPQEQKKSGKAGLFIAWCDFPIDCINRWFCCVVYVIRTCQSIEKTA